MRSERVRLLSVATAEEWRRWANNPFGWEGPCLLCRTYDNNCDLCMEAGGNDPNQSGCHSFERTGSEAAIIRLKHAGIWEEETA